MDKAAALTTKQVIENQAISERIFPDWPYQSRLAIGMSLADFWAKKSKTCRFEVNGTMYEIEKEKAQKLGKRYQMKCGAPPNIMPLEEFKLIARVPAQRVEQPGLFAH